jgi:hypothetical protein
MKKTGARSENSVDERQFNEAVAKLLKTPPESRAEVVRNGRKRRAARGKAKKSGPAA